MQERPANEDLAFYAFTLTADEAGQVFVGAQTSWVGFADEEYRIELREPRLVNWRMAELWSRADEPCLFVIRADELPVYFMVGGNALVEKSIAEALIPDWLKAGACHQDGLWGFIEADTSTATKRAPSPKLRMEVLKRDNRKCRICGRRPDDNVDIVLNVHHIRPWGQRGVTHLSNLITLCHTCHSGLEPHFDPSLFSYLSERNGDHRSAYWKGVENFRKVTKELIDKGSL